MPTRQFQLMPSPWFPKTSSDRISASHLGDENRDRLVRRIVQAGPRRWSRHGARLTLKTCRQFLPLSFSRLSSISMTSTKSFLLVSFCNLSLNRRPGPTLGLGRAALALSTFFSRVLQGLGRRAPS